MISINYDFKSIIQLRQLRQHQQHIQAQTLFALRRQPIDSGQSQPEIRAGSGFATGVCNTI